VRVRAYDAAIIALKAADETPIAPSARASAQR
jgi:hypothetical protein